MMCEIELKYLENTVEIPLVCLELFDGHPGSQVFSVAHFCAPTAVANPPDAYELPLEDV